MDNAQIQEQLDKLPDLAADALKEWRNCTISRESFESTLFLRFKEERISKGLPASDDYVKHMVRSNPERIVVCQCEATAEAAYYRLNERHMSNKKTASLRTSF